MATDHQELIRKATALRLAGHLPEATALIQSGLESVPAASTSTRVVRADLLLELTEVHLRTGFWTAAHNALDEAAELLGNNPVASEPHRWAAIMERRAWTLFREGKLRQAQTLAVNLLGRVESDPDANLRLLAGLHNTLGGIAWNEGRSEAAVRYVSFAAEYYSRAGDPVGAANARTNLGILNFSQGRWAEAAQQFSASDVLRTQSGFVAGRAANLLNLGVLQMSMGDHGAARTHFNEALHLSRDAGERYDGSRAEIALAHLDLLEAHFDSAQLHIDSALADASCIGQDDLVQATWLKALIENERGGSASGLQIAEQARKAARAGNLIDSESDACRALADSYRRSGQFERAEELLREAIALSTRAGDPYRRALAQFELGVLFELTADQHVGGRDREVARTQFDEALSVFQRLGAQYDVKRTETARARLAS